MKKFVCLVLAMVMALSICGMSAIAEEVTTDNSNTSIATEENLEISVDEKHFVVLFEGEKYSEMSFEDAVANGYLEEFSSAQLGTFCCPGNIIKGVVYPDGTYYSTSDENHPASSNTYEGYVVMLHNYTEHYYYFVRFLDTETDIKTYFENAGFETSEEDSSVVTSEKITFEGETYQELRIDMNKLDENGYYSDELIILEGNHILRDNPICSTSFIYDKSVGDYITYKLYPKIGSDASLSLYSYEGSVIAALLPQNEIVKATDETDEIGSYNAVIYLPDFAQYDGEEIIILFKSYNENFFVRLTAFVKK